MAYILIGAAVAAMSLFFNFKTGSQQMTLFLAAGVIFIVIGGIRLILRKPPKVVAPTPPRTHPAHPSHPQHQAYKEMAGAHRPMPAHPGHHPAGQPLPSGIHILYCENCQTKVYSTAKYCHLCGTKLRS